MPGPLVTLGPFVTGSTIPFAIAVTYDGTATDATEVTLRLRSPLGAITTYTLTSGAIAHGLTGQYSIAVTAGAAAPRGADGWTYSVTAMLPTSPTVEVGIQAGPLLIVADPTT